MSGVLWVIAYVPIVAIDLIGEWLNERATRKTEALLEQTRMWWREHHETRMAEWNHEMALWRAAEKEWWESGGNVGRLRPMPMPRCGPPAWIRM